QVAALHLEAGDGRLPPGEEASLEDSRRYPLRIGLVSVSGERNTVGRGVEEADLAFAELPVVPSSDMQNTDDVARCHERDAHQRSDTQSPDDRADDVRLIDVFDGSRRAGRDDRSGEALAHWQP